LPGKPKIQLGNILHNHFEVDHGHAWKVTLKGEFELERSLKYGLGVEPELEGLAHKPHCMWVLQVARLRRRESDLEHRADSAVARKHAG